MSAFHDQFKPAPEMEDVAPGQYRVWVTTKPIFQKAKVVYSPPYPGLDAGKRDNEPFRVRLCDEGAGFGEAQEKAWQYLIEHRDEVEANLRRKLFAQHRKAHQQFVEEHLPEFRNMRNYWKKIKDKLDWDDPSAIDSLYELVDIDVVDRGPEGCSYICVNFEAGWDQDHGIGILMHQSNVLASAARQELASGNPDSIPQAVKGIQAYDFDEGDLSLLG